MPSPIKPVAVSAALQSGTATGGFSWVTARLMAGYAAQAYVGVDETIVKVARDGRTNARAVITPLPGGGAVIAFRGSSAPKDFIQDAKARQVTELLWTAGDAVAKVHTGFLEDFEAISNCVTATVKGLLSTARGDSRPTIYVTGHSLGGALAILCALEFARQKIPVAGVYTFGQPRVGNVIFAELYDQALRDRTFRIVNQNDIVPRLPWIWHEYRHCGNEAFLPFGGGWQMNPSFGFKFISDMLGLYGAYRNRDDVLIREHFIAAYQKRIEFLSDSDNNTLRDKL